MVATLDGGLGLSHTRPVTYKVCHIQGLSHTILTVDKQKIISAQFDLISWTMILT